MSHSLYHYDKHFIKGRFNHFDISQKLAKSQIFKNDPIEFNRKIFFWNSFEKAMAHGKLQNNFPDNDNFPLFHWFLHVMLVCME